MQLQYHQESFFLKLMMIPWYARYKETRRTHPLAPLGRPLEGIKMERELLDELEGKGPVDL